MNSLTCVRRMFCRVTFLPFLLMAIFVAVPISTLAQNPVKEDTLEPGKAIERDLVGDQVHTYSIAMTSGQYLHVVTDQRGIDVVVTLFGPDGKKLAEVDSPNGTHGPEPIAFVTDSSGNYRLEVRSLEKDAPAGKYEAKLVELRAATTEDRNRVAAQQLYSEAELLREQGTAESYRLAITKYDQVLPLARAGGDRQLEINALNFAGLTRGALGDWKTALTNHTQLLALARSFGDRDMEANALANIGLAYHYFGESQKSLDFHQQALVVERAGGMKRKEATTLSNIGSVYDSVGERQKALEYFEKALAIARATNDQEQVATTINNIGNVYVAIGEKQKALDTFLEVLPLHFALNYGLGVASTLNNLGYLYFEMGDRQKALDYYNRSLPIQKAIGNRAGEANAINNMGMIYFLMEDYEKALKLYNEALNISQALGDRQREAYALANMGTVYHGQKDYKKALDYYVRSLELTRTVGDRMQEGATLNNIGLIYVLLGERDKALEQYNRALPISRAVGDRKQEALTLYNFAFLEYYKENFVESRARIEEAIAIIESLRTKIVSQELRASYFSTVQNYYEFYINLLMRMHKDRPKEGFDGAALRVSERGRARSLLETLSEANADIRQGVDSNLIERERTLQQQLNAKAQEQTKLLTSQHSEEQAAVMAREVTELTTQLQQLEATIRQKSPKYAALTQPQPLTLKEIQTKVLDPGTLLLEYSLGDERSFLWAVSQTSITSYELPKREVIEPVARRVYELLNARNKFVANETVEQKQARILQADQQYQLAAAELSKLVLAPVAGGLAGKRLLIVGDGALQYIPFGALPEPRSATALLSTPLIARHEIVTLPSASTLAVLREEVSGRAPAPQTLAVLADPVFRSDDQRVTGNVKSEQIGGQSEQTAKRDIPIDVARSADETGSRGEGLNLNRLPGTRLEAERILALATPLKRKQAFDFDANRATATSDELSKFRYVHFATHGFLNSIHPELSGLVFSLVNKDGQPENGFLRANEIFNLKLPAELVVLSACQTGLGKEIKGEGLVSMTRGFMYAGAPRVVVSLWSVSDQATAELMARFYRGMLQTGLRPSAALRAAQISLMKDKRWQSPFYWAAFTLQGEWR